MTAMATVTSAPGITAGAASVSGRDALTVFDAALRQADAGLPVTLTLCDEHGTDHPIDAAGWCRIALPGDQAMLTRCAGATLDVGCGPGRLTSALNRLGVPALGIDISAAAVRLARARGATAIRRNVFAHLPGSGRWRHLLLADGNIGIGGAPHTLLSRCRELLAPDGRLHAEVAAPGSGSWAGEVRLRDGEGQPSAPFRWAVVAADDLPTISGQADLHVLSMWTEANRWFATLIPA
jgi:SAM-dependent methyltransferase